MNLKIGYVIDSSSGLSKTEAEARGFYFLPLVVTINEKDYLDGDNLKRAEYYQNLDIKDNVKTSATPMGIVQEVIGKASRENDFVIVYPLSEPLSSQLNNIKIVTKDIKNVRVVKSKAIAVIIENEINEIKKFAKDNHDIDEIMEFANQNTNSWSALVVPQTLDWLVKGGRVNASIAAMASLLKIVPIIRFSNGMLDKEGKGRVYKKTCIKAAKKMLKASKNKKLHILIGNGEQEKAIYNQVKAMAKEVFLHYIPPVIANHCGPNSFIVLAKIK